MISRVSVRFWLPALVSTAVLLCALPALAEDEADGNESEEGEEQQEEESKFALIKPDSDDVPEEEKGFFRRYADFWWSELERIDKMDLWGESAQLPKGFFKVKYEYSYIRAANRWDNTYHKTALLPPIGFSDDQGNDLISIDLGGSGHGEGHYFQFSYGITDDLDFYFELPFQSVHVKLAPKAEMSEEIRLVLRGLRGTNCDALGRCNLLLGKNPNELMPGHADYIGDTELFLRTLEMVLGRPRPGLKFDGTMELADINTGFSWNFYRGEYFSAHITPRVHLPSGKFANPDNSLTFATGPELDRGTGSFGVSMSMGYDIRAPRFWKYLSIILSLDVTGGYMFESEHEYPSVFGGRGTPAYREELDDVGTRGFSRPLYKSQEWLDNNPLFRDTVMPGLDPELYFPDLSGITGKTYKYVPGSSVSFTAKLGISLFGVGLSIGYGHLYNQEPVLIGDPNFVAMVKNLEILGDMEADEMQVGISIPLYLIYLPIEVAYGYQWNIGGRNLVVFDNHHIFTINGVLPDLIGRAIED